MRPFVFLFVLLISAEQAHAYRGVEYASEEREFESPASLFPGYFNTFTAPRGKFIFEVPTSTLDYGLTKDLTVGINLLPLTYALLWFRPALTVKGRYRFFS